jgi:molybdate transport system regulatory protein
MLCYARIMGWKQHQTIGKGAERMQLSARNQLPGTVMAVKEGAVMAEVVVTLDGGMEVVSAITVDSARRLKLAVGSKVTVIIKATEVLLATND